MQEGEIMSILAFTNGISTIGNLRPKALTVPEKTVYSAWVSVANDFYKVGNDLRSVIIEANRQQK